MTITRNGFGTKPKRKIKGINNVIKQQELFIEQVNMTLKFLKMYQGNPRDFEVMIGDEVAKHYKMNESWGNAEWMWESIDEMTCDIVYKYKKFKFTANGIFRSLHFAKATPKSFIKDLNEWFMEGDWAI